MRNTLIFGDCLEKMNEIPDGSIDLVLCDLPYGMTRNAWDKIIPFEKLWEQYHRICKPTTPIVLHCMPPFSAKLIMSNLKDYKYSLYWDKHLKTGFLNAKKQPLRQVEEIAVFYQKQCLYTPPVKKGNVHYRNLPSKSSSNYNLADNRKTTCSDEYCATTLISDYPKQQSKHPTGKSIPLTEYLIKTYTKEGDTVLDNAMGSGTTGVACKNTNRNFIGIEIDPQYFAIAKERIEQS